MTQPTRRGTSKRRGAALAKEWIRIAPQRDKVRVAAAVVDYGFTLTELADGSTQLPVSSDKDFSWGFYKQVKSHVFHVLRSHQLKRRSDSSIEWDVFISHASEDKDTVVRELAADLVKKGLRVWYDEFTLTIGDSLRRSIDYGLSNSRYGIVLLSPAYLKKEWAQKELDGLMAREIAGVKVILPIWHNISIDLVRRHSPLLADRVAANTKVGLAKVAEQIVLAVE